MASALQALNQGRLSETTSRLHVVILLDSSTSMESHREKVVRAYNRFLADQQAIPATVYASRYTFGEHIERTVMTTPVGRVNPLSVSSYVPNGGTALYDAIAQACTDHERVIGAKDRVLVAVLTDGEDTSSKMSARTLRSQVDQLKATERWQFLYIGPGSGRDFGFTESRPWGEIEQVFRELTAATHRFLLAAPPAIRL